MAKRSKTQYIEIIKDYKVLRWIHIILVVIILNIPGLSSLYFAFKYGQEFDNELYHKYRVKIRYEVKSD